jgi:hypothetical protein
MSGMIFSLAQFLFPQLSLQRCSGKFPMPRSTRIWHGSYALREPHQCHRGQNNRVLDTLSACLARRRPDPLRRWWARALRFEGVVLGKHRWRIITG